MQVCLADLPPMALAPPAASTERGRRLGSTVHVVPAVIMVVVVAAAAAPSSLHMRPVTVIVDERK